MKSSDVLIIGSGLAGLSAAIYLAEAGKCVVVITKADNFQESNSSHAQGGIIYKNSSDSPDELQNDIINAGDKLSYLPAVEQLASEGPATVEDLLIKKTQTRFTREGGDYHLTAEGGHSRRRILHDADESGKTIIQSLLKKAHSIDKITLLNNHIAIDLITREHNTSDLMSRYEKPECLGAYIMDLKTKKVASYLAESVILGTGGLGQVYLHTTNPAIATGDGFAMAMRSGAILINMEYTQFHPTTLFHPKGKSFLISEAVRGEGGKLVTQDGTSFMMKYHPKGNLAPRDVVTRAILQELQNRDESFVYLDLSPIDKKEIIKRFPGIRKHCLQFNIDITEQPIPIVPAFHFSCGGIRVNNEGRTNLQRLYAAGEVSCTGLHGANRLASTSLLECIVWGRKCADDIVKRSTELPGTDSFPNIPQWIDKGLKTEYDSMLLAQDWSTLKNIMWHYVGPLRTTRRLDRAFSDLRHLQEDIEEFYRNTRLDRPIVELRNAVQTALAIAGAARRNRRSLGCHYRED